MVTFAQLPREAHMALRLAALPPTEGREGFSFCASQARMIGDLEELERRGMVRIIHRTQTRVIACATESGRAYLNRLDGALRSR